ncbi:MAG: patatin-like phospholipase family protein [Verrucomicrobia bacterium]|nr:patatin-like phospholipase family protein [Verrucomicrobiota bacterium]
MKLRNRKVGLALGAGAARGWAHLGVIDALEDAGVRVDCIAGTSIGALVGGVYSFGAHQDLAELALSLNWRDVIYYFSDLSFSRSGLVDGKKVVDFIGRHMKAADIKDMPIPFAAVATDINTGTEVVMRKGDALAAIRASISLPGIFTPVQIDGRMLVDGGLVNPVPVSVLRQMGADYIIAVDVNHDRVKGASESQQKKQSPPRRRLPSRGHTGRLLAKLSEALDSFDLSSDRFPWLKKSGSSPHVFDVIGNSLRIMEAQISEVMLKADPPDLLIRPQLGHVGFMEFNKASEVIEAGYAAAKPAVSKVPRTARIN